MEGLLCVWVFWMGGQVANLTCSSPSQGLQEEGLDLGTQIEAVRPLAQGNSNHQRKVDQISSDRQALKRSLEVRDQ